MKSSLRKLSFGTSLAVLIICLVLVTGSTFSLFTSNSKVDIAVTSGTVDIDATIDDTTLKTWSLNETEEDARTDGSFANEGSWAKVEEGKLILKNITPGDNAKVTVDVNNESTVAVAYRLVLTISGPLAEALDIEITTPAGDFEYGYTNWVTVGAGEEIGDITVHISFPDAENNNDYQGLDCSISFVLEAVQGNGDFVDPITYNEETGVYEVNSEEGMMLINNIISTVSHGEGRSLKFALTADMDMTGYEWIPSDFLFVNLDGQGHTVSNLNCGVAYWGKSGFIGYAGGAVIENLTLENVTAVGTQAGVVAGSLEGATLTGVTIKGANSVKYDETKNPEETWGGVGAITGVAQNVKASTVTIAEGATITVDYNGLVTEAPAQNEYALISDISGFVTNNGTVETIGTPKFLEDGLGFVYGENGEKTLWFITEDYTDTTLVVPEGTTALRNKYLNGNTTITEVVIPVSLTNFGGTPNSAGTSATGGFFYGSAVEKVTLPEGLTEIPVAAFNQAANLKEVNIPSSVTTIGINAFAGTGLTELTVPATVTSIGYGAFRDMANLTTVTIEGDSVYIPDYAFRACKNLTTVLLNVNTLTLQTGNMTFTNTSTNNEKPNNITIYVTNDAVYNTLTSNNNIKCTIVIVDGIYSDENVTDLDSALQSGSDVVLTEDVNFSANDTTANSGYGATGVLVNGGTLDGNGNTLTVNDAWSGWDCAVNVKSGSIKNLTINSAMRGIFMGSANGDVYIDNVIIDGTVYTFNSDGGSKDYGVYISNSTLNGWTSFSNVHKEVVFTNCSFGEGQGHAFCRPYNAPAVFVNCVFEEGFEFDTSKTSDIVFTNCYYGDTLITAENAATLGNEETTFFYNGLNGITIDGKKVDDVENSDELLSAVENGAVVVVLLNGEYDIPNFSTLNGVKFIGENNTETVIKLYNTPSGGDFCLAGSTATLENLKIVTEVKDWAGFQNAENLTFNKCEFENNLFLSGNATFNECHFTVTTNHYNVWAYSSNSRTYTAEFNNCVFDCAGKSIYIDGNSNGTTTMKFTECTFNDNDGGATDKAAIETGTTYGAGATYNVVITDCEFNGFATGKNTDSTIWANKNSMTADKLNIIVDGVELY